MDEELEWHVHRVCSFIGVVHGTFNVIFCTSVLLLQTNDVKKYHLNFVYVLSQHPSHDLVRARGINGSNRGGGMPSWFGPILVEHAPRWSLSGSSPGSRLPSTVCPGPRAWLWMI